MCDIHKSLTTNELVRICIHDKTEILNLMFDFTTITRTKVISSFGNFMNDDDYIKLLRMGFGNIKHDRDVNMDHYVNKLNNIDIKYANIVGGSMIIEKVKLLINFACNCKPHSFIMEMINNNVLDVRKNIFMDKHKIHSIIFHDGMDIFMNTIIAKEVKLMKYIPEILLDKITPKMKTINLKDYDINFLIENFSIHPNNIDYVCDEILKINFMDCVDIHMALYDEIYKANNKRIHIIHDNIYKHMPYKINNIAEIDIDTILSKYNVNIKRYPIIKKILNEINFDDESDHQQCVGHKIALFLDKICNETIENFPLMYENIVFDKNNMLYVLNKDTYEYPKSELKKLITILNNYDFGNCSDIHLTLHNIILQTKKNLVRTSRVPVNINLSDIYYCLTEKTKTKIIHSFIHGLLFYLNEKNKVVYHYGVYKDGDYTPKIKKIKFDISICMFCDAQQTKLPKIEFRDSHIFCLKDCNDFYTCDNICRFILLNNKHIKNHNNNVGNLYYGFDNSNRIYALRHFGYKILFLRNNWINSNFYVMNVDIMNIIIDLFMVMVF